MRRVFVGLAISLAAVAPSWVRADDDQIAQEIVQELKSHQDSGELRGFKIDLEVDEGTVLLTGHVADAEQHHLALNVARRTDGVKQVVDDLTIASAADPAPKTKGADPTDRKLRLGLNRFNPFSARQAKDKSEAPVAPQSKSDSPKPQQEIAPVSGVSREIEAPAISDEQIASQIYQKVQQHQKAGRLHGFRLDMKVEEGTVILDGYVATADQKRLALDVARYVPGVVQVVDMIQVQPGQAAARVRNASTNGASARRSPAVALAAQTEVPGALQPTPAAPLPGSMAPAPEGSYYAAPSGAGLAPAMPMPAHYASQAGIAQARYDHPQLPGYAWPSYAAYPNYTGVSYPRQYSPAAWPYIGPFYPYPQVPLGWRKVTLKWDDGWWFLDFNEK